MAVFESQSRALAFLDGPFADLLSLAEFAAAHGVDDSTIRHQIRNGNLREGIDYSKFGKQWVLSKEAFKTYWGSYAKYTEVCQEAQGWKNAVIDG